MGVFRLIQTQVLDENDVVNLPAVAAVARPVRYFTNALSADLLLAYGVFSAVQSNKAARAAQSIGPKLRSEKLKDYSSFSG